MFSTFLGVFGIGFGYYLKPIFGFFCFFFANIYFMLKIFFRAGSMSFAIICANTCRRSYYLSNQRDINNIFFYFSCEYHNIFTKLGSPYL